MKEGTVARKAKAGNSAGDRGSERKTRARTRSLGLVAEEEDRENKEKGFFS